MLSTFSGSVGMQRCRIYLEDDRIEVGRTGFAYVEDLSRVAYRDVYAVSFAAVWNTTGLVLAGVLALAGAICVVIALNVSDSPASSAAVFLVVAGLFFALGIVVAVFARKGSVLRFRVDGLRGHVSGAVSARRATRERFRAELLGRIEAAKQRALTAQPEAPPPPSA